MNLRTLAVGAVSAALLVATPVGIANAADDPADCGAAITVLTKADAANDAAIAADKAAADAKKADTAATDAERRLSAAITAAVDAGVVQANQTQAMVDALRKRIKELNDLDELTDEQRAELATAQKQLPLVQAVLNAKEARDKAVKLAGETDADTLQDKADETDAAATLKALNEARADFDRLCTNGEDDPTDDKPAPERVEHVVITPKGGVNTGGGPA